MNVSNLELVLVQKISNSTSTLDTLIYSKALQELKTGTVTVIDSVNDLPSDRSSFIGHLFYAKNSETLYFITSNGGAQALSVGNTGTLFAWGTSVLIGDGGNTTRSSPVTVAGSIKSWCAISVASTSAYHAMGLKTDGTLWTWGANATSGELGNGGVTGRSCPGGICGGGSTWSKIAAGFQFSGAIKSDGTLWTWGGNGAGQLGDGSTTSRSSPGTVIGDNTNWCCVSAGRDVMAGIKTDGTLWTWGCGNLGRLGDGTTTSRSSPGTTAGCGTNWRSVSLGEAFGLALKTDGTLWTWGYNTCGRLGDGSTTNRSSPGTVAGGGSTWCAVSAGNKYAAAIKTDGTLWTWGDNTYGQLGSGLTGYLNNRCSPGTTAGGGTTWCAVKLGRDHSVALKTDGTLWTWGFNNNGMLGDNTATSRCSPGTIVGGITNWSIINAGDSHSSAIVISTGNLI